MVTVLKLAPGFSRPGAIAVVFEPPAGGPVLLLVPALTSICVLPTVDIVGRSTNDTVARERAATVSKVAGAVVLLVSLPSVKNTTSWRRQGSVAVIIARVMA